MKARTSERNFDGIHQSDHFRLEMSHDLVLFIVYHNFLMHFYPTIVREKDLSAKETRSGRVRVRFEYKTLWPRAGNTVKNNSVPAAKFSRPFYHAYFQDISLYFCFALSALISQVMAS